MPIYVLIYDAQDGCQPELYSTEEKALRGAARIIADDLENINDEECQQEIADALASQNFAEALALWEGYQCDRADPVKAISITDLEIDQHDSGEPIEIALDK